MSNSKYNAWTWLIAILLVIYLFWQAQHHHGMGGCCATVNAPVVAEPAIAPVSTPFSFQANVDGLNTSGDATEVVWLSQQSDLVAWLQKCGQDCQVSGGSQSIVLTGTVASEETKIALGQQAQAFFGTKISVDNQLTVKVAEQVVIAPPPMVKIYFDTAKTELPGDAAQTLQPMVDWMQANSNAKIILSGYHDITGNKMSNETLAKNRAETVKTALKKAGIAEERIEMRKPEVVDGGGDLAEARRVEVLIE